MGIEERRNFMIGSVVSIVTLIAYFFISFNDFWPESKLYFDVILLVSEEEAHAAANKTLVKLAKFVLGALTTAFNELTSDVFKLIVVLEESPVVNNAAYCPLPLNVASLSDVEKVVSFAVTFVFVLNPVAAVS